MTFHPPHPVPGGAAVAAALPPCAPRRPRTPPPTARCRKSSSPRRSAPRTCRTRLSRSRRHRRVARADERRQHRLAARPPAPALVYSEAGGESQLYIRGIGSNIFSVGVDQSVATHIDGIYVGRAEHGPDAVPRRRARRDPARPAGHAVRPQRHRRRDQPDLAPADRRGRGLWLDPLRQLRPSRDQGRRSPARSAPAGRRASHCAASKDDGYTEDLDPAGSNKIDDTDLQAIRGTLKWSNDTVTATLSGDYSEFQNGNTSIYPIDNVGLAESFGAVPTGDIHKTRNNTPSFHDWQTGGLTLNLDWKINDTLTLTSLTGYREWDSDFLFNTDGTEIEITRSTFIYGSSQKSTELRLAGDQGWGNWLVGALLVRRGQVRRPRPGACPASRRRPCRRRARSSSSPTAPARPAPLFGAGDLEARPTSGPSPAACATARRTRTTCC